MDARVIVAHDPACDAAVIGRVLASHGYRTRSVNDGAGLLALAGSWRPDAAVIDLGLQGISAFDAARSLRKDFSGDIKLIAFTHPSAPELETTALSAGFDHVVVEVANAAEILLTLSDASASLVARARQSSVAFVETMFSYAENRLEVHFFLRDPRNRMRSIAMLRRAIETLGQSAALSDESGRLPISVRLAALEEKFQRLVEQERVS